MILYFVRHGESVANVLREFSNTGTKHPLTEKGVAQAQALAEQLAGLPVAQIYTSPVLRARQTAQILAERLGLPVEVTEALREIDVGIYEGTTDPAGWQQHRQVYEDWSIRHLWDSKMTGGESFNETLARFLPFIQDLTRAGPKDERTILLVSHGGLYGAMLPYLFKNVDFDFAAQHPFANTAYAVAETLPDGLYCRLWCGVSPDG